MENVGKDIDRAAKDLILGNLVVFPTETVYGLGANALNEKAVKSIFKAKNRPKDNPLIVHVSSIEMAEKIVTNISEIERKLMNMFWPGPLSIILTKNDIIPDAVTCGLNTVSVRMPDNKLALELIQKANIPIAAPSANKSGKPSGTNIEDIYDELKEDVAYFLDDGRSKIGIESTVVKVNEDGKIVILRPGKITVEDLEKISKVEVDKNCFREVKKEDIALSPGMKHRHYAPNAKCTLLSANDKKKMIEKINDIIINSSENIAFMVMEDIIDSVNKKENVKVYNLGSTLDEVSKNIFNSLRKIDKDNIDICYIQAVEKKGIGLGIMNRIIRACEYNIVEV